MLFCFVEIEFHYVAKVGLQQVVLLPQPTWPVSTIPSFQCQSCHPGLPACHGRTQPAASLSFSEPASSAGILPLITFLFTQPGLGSLACAQWSWDGSRKVEIAMSYSVSSQLRPHDHTLSVATQISCKPTSLEA